jgi:hypothetical protein
MKVIRFIPYSFIIASLFLASGILMAEAFVPWGLVADDESVIQPFTTSRSTGKDYRIPQDEDLIEIDYFYVYLEWRGSQTTREFILQFSELKQREIIVGDIITTEEYWDVYAEKVVSMVKGANEWNDPRFALKKIDNNELPDFKKSDSKEMIKILYRNLEIEFFHRTSYAEVEQTKTIQAWNLEAIILAAWVVFLGFLAGGFSRWILNRATYVPDLPHWSIWIILFLFLFIASILFLLIAGYDLDSIIRVILIIPAPVLAVFVMIYFAFWLAARFRPKRLREFLFIILDLPKLEDVKSGIRKLRDEHDLPVDAEIMEGYINPSGEIELVNDPDSYWETFRRVKMGGIKFNMKKLGKRIRIKQRFKNFDDIIFCEKFEKQDLEVKVKPNALASISSVIIIVGIFTWIVPLIFNFASILFSILGTIFLGSGILFFFWENVEVTSPIITVTPITDRDAITIIRDKLTLEMKDQEISDLELEMYKTQTSMVKKVRAQTRRALEEIADAVLPIKEIAEEEIDIDELPKEMQKLIKKWSEDWTKNKSLGDLLESTEEKATEEKNK